MALHYTLKKVFYSTILCLILLTGTYSYSSGKVKIAVWGDSRENKDNACEHIASILLHKITDWDFQIHTGDFTHAGEEADWQRSLSYQGMERLFVPGKMFLCTSNHDDNQTTWDKYTAGVLPINSADSTTHFYAYQKENVHVVMCDAYFTDSTTMQNWLDQYLATVNDEDWLIGVWHNPCYGDLTYKKSYLGKCKPWLESFYRHGGDFILHGHAHIYLRTKPLLPDGTVDQEKGMVHIINGTGGATWEPAQKYVDKTAFTPNSTSFPCITFITFDGKTATVQTIDARPKKKLEVIDEWKWSKENK
ncbi:MAG: metallophosphoesterase [candidate division KSB1 bacterium]|nr:metallophosphoesterase [candidate division KSB1 bacterium]